MISRRQFHTYGAAGLALAQGSTWRAEAAGSTATAPATASRMMRALQLTAFRRPLQVAEVPVPAPRTDGAVVRVEACKVCRSEWHFWNEDWTWMGLHLQLPTVLGHEVGGVVEEVGPDVRNVKVGDRVTIPFHEADDTYPHCRAGYQNLCDHEVIPGLQRSGGWSEYITVSTADLIASDFPRASRPFPPRHWAAAT